MQKGTIHVSKYSRGRPEVIKCHPFWGYQTFAANTLHPRNLDTKNDGLWKMYFLFSNMASFWCINSLDFRDLPALEGASRASAAVTQQQMGI